MKAELLLFLLVFFALSEAREDRCRLPIVSGPCRAYVVRWAMNTRTGKCEKFIYGGCGGNRNNFKSKKECERKCLRRRGGRGNRD
ncbi:unnamed protein product [Hymenolepis diminuta]|uniref:BPTI/Kunitz inhibitor domain-containing protein n=1 Tax=Hymenolepis diminuta TaxID=6216 RepID=A0A0R3SXS4_HYMDI|nr:unnamed protein product [Hymenolepis diminuta]VUZ49897.1 unnamed protein product [Hymenolepis diminuta]VUZ49899.1 unnamed protein product [Hymenolepis diminuta]